MNEEQNTQVEPINGKGIEILVAAGEEVPEVPGILPPEQQMSVKVAEINTAFTDPEVSKRLKERRKIMEKQMAEVRERLLERLEGGSSFPGFASGVKLQLDTDILSTFDILTDAACQISEHNASALNVSAIVSAVAIIFSVDPSLLDLITALMNDALKAVGYTQNVVPFKE